MLIFSCLLKDLPLHLCPFSHNNVFILTEIVPSAYKHPLASPVLVKTFPWLHIPLQLVLHFSACLPSKAVFTGCHHFLTFHWLHPGFLPGSHHSTEKTVVKVTSELHVGEFYCSLSSSVSDKHWTQLPSLSLEYFPLGFHGTVLSVSFPDSSSIQSLNVGLLQGWVLDLCYPHVASVK